MCGLFGWTGKINETMFKMLLKAASTRGPHGFGVTWQEEEEIEPKTFKRCGVLDGNSIGELPICSILSKALYGIGHARLATCGNLDEIEGVHPIQSGMVFLCHNGNVYNYRELQEKFWLPLKTNTDSEALAAYISQRKQGYLRQRVEEVISLMHPKAPYALSVLEGQRIVIARYRHPLFVRYDPHASYFCSRQFEGFHPIPEDQVIYFKGREEHAESGH